MNKEQGKQSDPQAFYIVGEDDILLSDMMEAWGYKKSNNAADANIIMFTGGNDINPKMYGEEKLPECGTPDDERDRREKLLFEFYQDSAMRGFEKTFVGICRGGQILNVLNGGKLYQHVDNHLRSHEITDLVLGRKHPIMASADHHQMMCAGFGGTILAIAKESTEALSADKDKDHGLPPSFDTEAVWYEKTKTLCWQPHPEWDQHGAQGQEYFFRVLEKATA